MVTFFFFSPSVGIWTRKGLNSFERRVCEKSEQPKPPLGLPELCCGGRRAGVEARLICARSLTLPRMKHLLLGPFSCAWFGGLRSWLRWEHQVPRGNRQSAPSEISSGFKFSSEDVIVAENI